MKILLQAPPSWEGVGGVLIEKFPFVIGRCSQADRSLSLFFISRNHCRFSLRGDDVVVEDLGSSNGTYVNDVRLTAPAVLRHGDEVRLGMLPFRAVLQNVSALAAGAGVPTGAPNEASTVLMPQRSAAPNDNQAGRTIIQPSNLHVRGPFG